MSLVFFDVDGTLTSRDTILPLGLFLARTRQRKYFRMAALVFWMALLKLRVLSNHEFKQKFCQALLKGESEKRIEELSAMFASRYLEGVLNEHVVEALRRHQYDGDEVYLVSSNFAFWVRPLHQKWHCCGAIATNAEVREGVFTGRIEGQSCDGEEKLARVLALFDRDLVRGATAYGDSRGDCRLLGFVKRAVWI